MVYYTTGQDFTTLEVCHGGDHLIPCPDVPEVNRRIKLDLWSIAGIHGSPTAIHFNLLFSVRFVPTDGTTATLDGCILHAQAALTK